MFSLFALIRRYAHTILFVVLELVSFFLIINFNQQQKDIFIHSSSRFAGSASNAFSGVKDYFNLKNVNDKLLEENARLIQAQLMHPAGTSDVLSGNSFSYDVIPARIIGQTIHSLHNYITIDKGQNHGVDGTLGLITERGVVGILNKSSLNFSSGLSLLHTETRVSASVRGLNYFGTVRWNGRNFQKAQLEGIPVYATVAEGDTVITNGYSSIFPRDIVVGYVTSVETDPRRSYHDIELRLANDFYDLDYVYVIRNNFASERQEVELE